MMRFVPYLSAHFAKSQLWHASTLLFAFYLTERCGLRPADAGWIIGLSLIANGLADLIVGRHWRRAAASIASAGGMQSAFAPLSAVFFVLFAATALLPAGLRLAWALVMILGFRLFYPLIDVPQNALVPLLARSPQAQRHLLACRNIVSQIANLAVSIAAIPLLLAGAKGWTCLSWAAVVGLLTCISATLLARAAVHDTPIDAQDDAAELPVPAYAVLAVLLAVLVVAGATFRILEPYYAAFVVAGKGLLPWAAGGALVAQPLWLLSVNRLGVAVALRIVVGVLLMSAALCLGPLRNGAIGVALIAIGYGLGSGALWLALWSYMAVHASRRDALWRVSGFTCISKVCQGGAAISVGHMLQQTSYRLTLSDPLSMVSMAMPLALVAIAGACLSLTLVLREPRLLPAPS